MKVFIRWESENGELRNAKTIETSDGLQSVKDYFTELGEQCFRIIQKYEKQEQQ